MKPRLTALAAALLLAGAAHAGSLKSLPLDDAGCAKNLELQRGERYRIDGRAKDVLLVISEKVGFSVHTFGGKPLPVETRHVMDNGPPFDSVRAARLKKGRFDLNITQSGTASLICVHADG